MRILLIILSLYVILLAAMPCCLFDNCPNDKAVIEHSQDNHDQGDDDGCGTCSPFFNCNTCNSFILVASQTILDFSQNDAIVHFQNFYISAIIKSSTGKIWQPPKSV